MPVAAKPLGLPWRLTQGEMKIYPFEPSSSPAPTKWSTELFFQESGDTCQCICAVFCNGEMMCRLSAATPGGSSDRGTEQMAHKAKAWILDYLQRTGKQEAVLPQIEELAWDPGDDWESVKA